LALAALCHGAAKVDGRARMGQRAAATPVERRRARAGVGGGGGSMLANPLGRFLSLDLGTRERSLHGTTAAWLAAAARGRAGCSSAREQGHGRAADTQLPCHLRLLVVGATPMARIGCGPVASETLFFFFLRWWLARLWNLAVDRRSNR
jgi:hypothetical protein